MYQKSFPTRQLRRKHVPSFKDLSQVDRKMLRTGLRVFTGKQEVGLGGVCRCRDGGSSQNGRQRSSCSLKFQAVTCSYNLLGTAATTHRRQPEGLLTGCGNKSHKLKKQTSKDLNICIPPARVCTIATLVRFVTTEM